MKNLWKTSDAEKFSGAVGECVYGSLFWFLAVPMFTPEGAAHHRTW